MRYLKFTLFLGFILSSVPALAQTIGVFQRDLHDRITIENASAGDMTVTEKSITIPFKIIIDANKLAEIKSQARTISDISSSNGNLVLTFNEAVVDTQNFRIGDKVIVDLFYDSLKLENKMTEGANEKTDVQSIQAKDIESISTASEKIEPKISDETVDNLINTIDEQLIDEALTANDTVKPLATIAEIAKTKGDYSQEVVTIKKVEKLRVVDEVSPDETTPTVNKSDELLSQPTIISLSSIEPFGVAVFQRLGRLFIVTDNKNMKVPPQLSGFGAENGWQLNEIEFTNGKAWMMPLPEDAFVRPEGSGLAWKFIISDINPDLKSVALRRIMTNPKDLQIDIMLPNVVSLLKFTDPDYKDDLAIMTVRNSDHRMYMAFDFVDFDILPAFVGGVIKPQSDGMRLKTFSQYVSLTNANGLVLSSDNQDDIVQSYLGNDDKKNITTQSESKETLQRIYYFSDWGGAIKPHDYQEKRKELDQFLALSPKDSKLTIVLDLAKLALSQSMGQEALGYLAIANDLNPQIKDIAEYQALKGAAHFLASQYDVAETYFSKDSLAGIAETKLWLAASYAAQGKEQQAMEIYNGTANLASIYPYEIRRAVVAPIALAMLNKFQGDDALKLIDLIDNESDTSTVEQRATIAYLKGRALSLSGRPDEGIKKLTDASKGGKQGPYGIRAELLLIEDELAREVITYDDAIKRMESLRFAWKGDSLETEINQKLGNLYIQKSDPRTGLSILKRAASNSQSPQERREIIRSMSDAFRSIFIGESFEKTDPIVAVAVYDEFKELTPVGDVGNKLIDGLAEKLMDINMMSRAVDVLMDKMDRLGGGQHALKTGLKISAIQLLDREPENALKTLQKVDEMIVKYEGEDKTDLNNKIVLLKARALADTGNAEQALFMTEGLGNNEDVLRLRIDTAWKTGRWATVTDSLARLIEAENITASTPPTADQTQLILNQAVALSLSNQVDALQRFAQQYDLVMKQTTSYKTFLVVTRPQNISNLADRETLKAVTSEADLFKGFLESL